MLKVLRLCVKYLTSCSPQGFELHGKRVTRPEFLSVMNGKPCVKTRLFLAQLGDRSLTSFGGEILL